MDNDPPTNPYLSIQGKPVTATQDVTVDISVVDGEEVFIDGAIIDGPTTMEWIPVAGTTQITLTAEGLPSPCVYRCTTPSR